MHKTNRRIIGQNIKYYRKQLDLSQEKLGELTGINDKLSSFYETDKRIPYIYTIMEISEGLDVTIDKLCGITTPPGI